MIRSFSALYPKAWRARYGDELDALLAQQRLTPAAIVDLVLGALDAHLIGERGVSSMVSRWRTPGALAFTVGGLIWFAGDAVRQLLPYNTSQLGFLVVFGYLIVALGVIDDVRATRGGRAPSFTTATAGVVGLLAGATSTAIVPLLIWWNGDPTLWTSFVPLIRPLQIVSYGGLAVFASVAMVRNVLPRPPLAALAAASCGLLVLTLLPLPVFLIIYSWPVDWIQVSYILLFTMPLSWTLAGIASLVFRPARVGVALP